jgi:hypothetical protein
MGAAWRLRRCRLVEETFSSIEDLDLDPMIDERTEKQQKSVDRARAQSHLILRRSLAELRKLQKGRTNGKPAAPPTPEPEPVTKIFALSYHPFKGAPATETIYSDDSFCDSDIDAPSTPPPPAEFPGNAQCLCRSGKKYKNCCRKNAPSAPNRAA